MSPKVVVRRAEHDGAVDFKQGLPVLVRFLNVAVLHSPDSFLGGCERECEERVQHQAVAAAIASAVRRDNAARHLACKLEGEGRLPVRGPWTAVAPVPAP